MKLNRIYLTLYFGVKISPAGWAWVSLEKSNIEDHDNDRTATDFSLFLSCSAVFKILGSKIVFWKEKCLW